MPRALVPKHEQAGPQLGLVIYRGTRVGLHCSFALGRSNRLALRGPRRMDRWSSGCVPVLQIGKHRFDFVPVFRRIQAILFSTASTCWNAARINHSEIASMCTGWSNSALLGWQSCGLTRTSGRSAGSVKSFLLCPCGQRRCPLFRSH